MRAPFILMTLDNKTAFHEKEEKNNEIIR